MRSRGESRSWFIQHSVIDEDEYLRYRITERFNTVMKSLFDRHKKEARGRLPLLAKQIGLNISSLEQEELEALMRALENPSYTGREKAITVSVKNISEVVL